MLRWFERLIDPFAAAPLEQPPRSVLAFFLYYLRPIRGVLAAVLITGLVAGLVEIALFVFLADIVDRATIATSPATFIADNALILAAMAFIIVVIRPIVILINSGLTRLSLTPGLTNIVR